MEPIYQSRFIRAPKPTEEKAWCFERRFTVEKAVKEASVSLSALGVYIAALNGAEIPSYVLAPGWTNYLTRLQYQTYDITSLLRKGENLFTVTAGIGFRFHDTGRTATEELSQNDAAVIAALTIRYEDGSEETVHTDEKFRVHETKWRYTQMYNGDVYDETYTYTEDFPVTVLARSTDTLIPQEGEVIAEQEHLPVQAVIHTPKGETVFDFGQNLTGYLTFRIKGRKGDVCRISHGEILDRDGNFYNENYRAAKAETVYTCDGNEHVFKPRFTFYGFRYIRFDSWSGVPDPADFEAVVVHSDMERIGFFECSDGKLNRLYHNIIWGQKGNFLDVPTDCPQRDERLGWTGDAEVFCRCASLNYNTLKFYRKWLADMRDGQEETTGKIGRTVPRIFYSVQSGAGWADACTIVPWELWVIYGDKTVLYENLDMMRKWISYMSGDRDVYFSDEKQPFGDWLALDVPAGRYVGGTPKRFIALAFALHSLSLYRKAAAVCETVPEDFSEFERFLKTELYNTYMDGASYEAAFPNHDGFSLHTQTRPVLLLAFGLWRSEEERKALAAELDTAVKGNGNRLNTGFLGTPHILHALSDNGYAETAYRLLFQEAFPSWLYSVNRGATTMWEHWDGINEAGEMWDKNMNSFNHYAYGAVGDWIYANVLGIRTDEAEPGFAHTVLAPIATDRLQWAKGSIRTKYGTIASEWKRKGGKTEYVFTVPAGIRATVLLPGIRQDVGEGTHRFTV